jgi:two-component sensor histidine kinase
MVLHELVTNATKYGAFSTTDGQVSVVWRWHQNGALKRHLVFEWRELGGPAVTASTQPGYGTNVIRDLIPYELGGTVDLSFAPEGVRCILGIPGGWVAERSSGLPGVAHHPLQS